MLVMVQCCHSGQSCHGGDLARTICKYSHKNTMQGREHEWLFASAEGQGQVAQGCSAKRVIVVSLNRGHTFGSLKAVQGELSPLVMDLAPIASRQLEAAIPFMTTQEGIGSRWEALTSFLYLNHTDDSCHSLRTT